MSDHRPPSAEGVNEPGVKLPTSDGPGNGQAGKPARIGAYYYQMLYHQLTGGGPVTGGGPGLPRSSPGQLQGGAPTGASRWLLAIDTSTERAGIALTDGVGCAETAWDGRRRQTVTLLATIDHLLGLADLTVADLAAVAVATGPGTFNGLRVGVSAAKGLVLALGVPLLGVPTLDATALPFAVAGRPVIAVAAAGRGRLVWAVYAVAYGRWGRRSAPRNGKPGELAADAAALGVETIAAGELTDGQAAEIGAAGVRVPPAVLRGRRPAAVAALAWDRFAAGEADDPVALEPFYLHATSERGAE